jgi:hypothetical protein
MICLKSRQTKMSLLVFLTSKGWNIPLDQGLSKAPMTTAKFNLLMENVRSKWSQALKGEAESEAFNNTNNYFHHDRK